MTPTQEAAMRQALEAMSSFESGTNGLYEGEFAQEIAALKAALAEPMQEPVAYIHRQGRHWEVSERHLDDGEKARGWTEEPLYTAPRKPLTDEEILKAIGWDRAEMYMKLTPNFPVAEAKKETLKNARAIERAHGIGGNDE